jgi:general secretion pathway protein F
MQYQLLVMGAQDSMRMLDVAATSEADASSRAVAQGYRVISVKSTSKSVARSPSHSSSSSSWLTQRAQFDPGLFTMEFGALLDAGLSVTESLQTLGGRENASIQQKLYDPMLRTLQEGQTLSQAMSRLGDAFPALLVASVKASEYTGDLSTSLSRYAATYKRMRGLREKVVSASLYPALLALVGFLVMVFLLGVVVPKFAGLIDVNSPNVPAASKLLMGWGKLMNAYFAEILTVLVLLAAAFAFALYKGSARAWIGSRMNRLPVIGAYVQLYQQTQFWQTSAMLVEGGIPAPQAFSMSVNLLGSDDAQRVQAALAQINSGQEMADAFNTAGVVDSVSYRMLKVAQKTGQLGRALSQLANFQNDVLERGIDRLTRLLEPVLMIVIGFAVGGIVVLMYLPIFDLASSIQ